MWKEHEKFLKIAKVKKVFVKAVITPKTSIGDIERMRDIVQKVSADVPIVLQPVTLPFESGKVDIPDMVLFRDMLKNSIKRVDIIEQVHKLIGVK